MIGSICFISTITGHVCRGNDHLYGWWCTILESFQNCVLGVKPGVHYFSFSQVFLAKKKFPEVHIVWRNKSGRYLYIVSLGVLCWVLRNSLSFIQASGCSHNYQWNTSFHLCTIVPRFLLNIFKRIGFFLVPWCKWLTLWTLKDLFVLYVYKCLPACVYVHCMWACCPQRSEDDIRSFQTIMSHHVDAGK